jgi:hypothetical protein
MAEGVGILRTVVLGHVHVEVSYSSRLLAVVTQRPSSSRCGCMSQHLLGRLVHGVADHEGSHPGHTGAIFGVLVYLRGRLVEQAAHDLDMGDSMSDFDRDEI